MLLWHAATYVFVFMFWAIVMIQLELWYMLGVI